MNRDVLSETCILRALRALSEERPTCPFWIGLGPVTSAAKLSSATVLLGVALWLRLKLGRLGETAWNGDPAAAAFGHGAASRI